MTDRLRKWAGPMAAVLIPLEGRLLVPTGLALGVAALVAAVVGAETAWRALLALSALATTLLLARHQSALSAATATAARSNAEIAGYWALPPLPSDPALRPWLGDFALSASAAASLSRLVARERPRRVLELGPGQSTLLLLSLAEQLDLPLAIVAVEHDNSFFDDLGALLGETAPCVHLVHAPLTSYSRGSWSGPWYSRSVVENLDGLFDLIIVDGPPGPGARMARYPAVSVVESSLSEGGYVFVDDTDRRDEQRCVEAWVHEVPALRIVREGPDWTLLRKIAHESVPVTRTSSIRG